MLHSWCDVTQILTENFKFSFQIIIMPTALLQAVLVTGHSLPKSLAKISAKFPIFAGIWEFFRGNRNS